MLTYFLRVSRISRGFSSCYSILFISTLLIGLLPRKSWCKWSAHIFACASLQFSSVIVSFPGCFVDLLHHWLDQSKSRASFLPYGPPKPEHPGSKSGTLFGRLPGEAALAVAGAVQLWAGHYWKYILNLFLCCFVGLSLDMTLNFFS